MWADMTEGEAENFQPEQQDSPDDPFVTLTEGLRDLTNAMQQMSTQWGREHDRAAVREKVIDRLHEENERLRAGDRHLVLRPLLTDIQRTRHEMLRESARLPEQMTGRQVAEILRSFAYSLELSLQRGGVEIIVPPPGAAVDPVRHRITAMLSTSDQVLDATIATVAMDGYFDTVSDRVTTPAEVHVHRWIAAPAAAGQPESSDLTKETTDEL